MEVVRVEMRAERGCDQGNDGVKGGGAEVGVLRRWSELS